MSTPKPIGTPYRADTSTSPSVGTPIERYDNNEGTGFLCSCGDDTVGLTLAPVTAYTMTVTCNGAEVGTHYAFILAPAAVAAAVIPDIYMAPMTGA